MNTALILLAAMMLDAILGEPDWLWRRFPHPAVLMGRLIGACDQRFNTGSAKRMRGALVLIGLVIAAGMFGAILAQLGPLVEIIAVAILLAQKSLVDHVARVGSDLRLSLDKGRASVAMIVGRDTDQMDQNAVVRSAIESAAENLSDGVIAPVFWFLIGGLPGLFIYKITNTADSMIGYRTPKHEAFGWAAARFDDLINLIPARLTALMIATLYGQLGGWRAIVSEARQHRSPNAGWPEAAMARALNVALSGPRSYNGIATEFSFVNPDGARHLGPSDIEAACRALWITWGGFVAILLFVALV